MSTTNNEASPKVAAHPGNDGISLITPANSLSGDPSVSSQQMNSILGLLRGFMTGGAVDTLINTSTNTAESDAARITVKHFVENCRDGTACVTQPETTPKTSNDNQVQNIQLKQEVGGSATSDASSQQSLPQQQQQQLLLAQVIANAIQHQNQQQATAGAATAEVANNNTQQNVQQQAIQQQHLSTSNNDLTALLYNFFSMQQAATKAINEINQMASSIASILTANQQACILPSTTNTAPLPVAPLIIPLAVAPGPMANQPQGQIANQCPNVAAAAQGLAFMATQGTQLMAMPQFQQHLQSQTNNGPPPNHPGQPAPDGAEQKGRLNGFALANTTPLLTLPEVKNIALDQKEAEAAPMKAEEMKLSQAGNLANSLMLTRESKKQPGEKEPPRVSMVKANVPWAHLTEGSIFADFDYYGMVSDALFLSMASMKPCGLTQDDQVGKYRNRKIGFIGLCCRHCGGQPGFGRYFPGSFDSFLNGKSCDGIVDHVASLCRFCPTKIRETVKDLVVQEKTATKRTAYGARKRFFSHIWKLLRDEKTAQLVSEDIDAIVGHVEDAEVESVAEGEKATETGKCPEAPDDELNDMPWETILSGSEIVSVEDRGFVSDTIILAFAQMTPCNLTKEDQVGRCKSHMLGFVGMCCRHCGGKAGKPGYGRYFPSNIRSLSQIDSCMHIINHISSKCRCCPMEVRSLLLELQLLEKSNRTRYGSRKIFFRRVWSRLHGDGDGSHCLTKVVKSKKKNNKVSDTDTVDRESDSSIDQGDSDVRKESEDNNPPSAEDDDIQWDILLRGSKLVTMKDKGLVSSAQFAAVAQMHPCSVTEADRIGWYKNRKVGFGGLQCRHCGGRPSAGRYFPNSVRSLAQTTSSQTIISHVASYCQECPNEIREAVIKLQEREVLRQKLSGASNNPMYGSRKTFYNRIWKRIHEQDKLVDDSDGSGWESQESQEGQQVSFELSSKDGTLRATLSKTKHKVPSSPQLSPCKKQKLASQA